MQAQWPRSAARVRRCGSWPNGCLRWRVGRPQEAPHDQRRMRGTAAVCGSTAQRASQATMAMSGDGPVGLVRRRRSFRIQRQKTAEAWASRSRTWSGFVDEGGRRTGRRRILRRGGRDPAVRRTSAGGASEGAAVLLNRQGEDRAMGLEEARLVGSRQEEKIFWNGVVQTSNF